MYVYACTVYEHCSDCGKLTEGAGKELVHWTHMYGKLQVCLCLLLHCKGDGRAQEGREGERRRGEGRGGEGRGREGRGGEGRGVGKLRGKVLIDR